ncbi:acyl-CoA dehydrogenase family protein [Thermoproteus tenax]|uniref:Acyl-CoA dehydrogenase n=1 Tax=Thermoproteus tenax (strain ATCC 35583 / DSM 2078 / JCM 9277 / NBRC 100435 / Kra 1) TaxID=768679 RepID=G4RJL1_THETK|nr:acyl-CoA dehydrogenase family protein [Thermoproteus tenax]CCC81756.1 acyl-CoA dehydrogenase [Thermoproteus tenax Kra 1]
MSKYPQLGEEHELVRKTAREFAERRVVPAARAIDEGNYPRDLLREMGDLGLLAPHIPQEFGGAGLDFRSMVIVVEEIAKASPALATVAEVQGSMISYNLYRYAQPNVREKWLEDVAKGRKIVAFALSEPCCGSDAAAIQTRAERRGGEWVINGVKLWITSGLYADAYLVAARTGPPELRHKSISLFLVERSRCIETSPIKVMGVHGTGTAEVKFNDCVVGEEALVGKLNEGFQVVLDDLNNGRTCVGAIGLGIAEAAFAEAYAYSKKRTAFGRPLAEFQVLQHYLANAYVQTEAVRNVVYLAAFYRDADDPSFPMYAQLAKVLGSRLAVETTRVAMQIMGGFGYSTESRVEMLYRDAKATEIYEGANEVILNTIYKFLEKAL